MAFWVILWSVLSGLRHTKPTVGCWSMSSGQVICFAVCRTLLALVGLCRVTFGRFSMLNQRWRQWSLSVSEITLIGGSAQYTRRETEVRKAG